MISREGTLVIDIGCLFFFLIHFIGKDDVTFTK